MEQWIRDNFDIVNYEFEIGTPVECFEYEKDGKIRRTRLQDFLNNQSEYQNLIDYWEQKGLNPPV